MIFNTEPENERNTERPVNGPFLDTLQRGRT